MNLKYEKASEDDNNYWINSKKHLVYVFYEGCLPEGRKYFYAGINFFWYIKRAKLKNYTSGIIIYKNDESKV